MIHATGRQMPNQIDAPYRPAVAAGVPPAGEPGGTPGGRGRSQFNAKSNTRTNPGGRMPPSTAGGTPAATAEARFLSMAISILAIATIAVSAAEEPPLAKFTDITAAAGITFSHVNGAYGDKLLPETMGGGVAFFDFDNDGHPDLLFINSCYWPEI